VTAVIGPPWSAVATFSAKQLALDAPVLHDAAALAVYSPTERKLARCRNAKEAALRAEVVSHATGSVTAVLKGCMQLRSGLWYWPNIVEVVDTRKALDPLKRQDRALIARRLSREMTRAARIGEKPALAETLDLMLGAQWGSMTDAQMQAVYETTRTSIMTVGTTSAMTAATTKAGETLFKVAEKSRRAKVFGISEAFKVPDARALRRMNANMPFFVTADYGRRVDIFVEQDALNIIQGGLRLGLDDVVVGKELHAALAARVVGRTESYFNMLASVTMQRAAVFGQLTGYKDAKIQRFEWVAVMDGATCNICRLLHGEVFEVGQAFSQLQGAGAPGRAPDQAIMEDMPWYREHDGGIHLAPTTRGGPIGERIADVVNSAVGQNDNTGTFNILRTPQEAGGTKSPPAHGLCRCITLPVMT
jgi:SPP1 gp7 family putative phage head morphogenesis protein